MDAIRVFLLAVVGTILASPAHAQLPLGSSPPKRAPEPFRHRASFGLGVGILGGTSKLDGERGEDNDGHFNGSFDFALEERFAKHWSLAGRATLSTWDSSWSSDMGYNRTRWDLGLEPRFWVSPTHAQRIEAYFGAGVGVTLPSDHPPVHRAYTETIDGHPGYYLMPRVGGSLQLAKYFCLYLELGYALHVTELDATLEPKIPNMPRTVEERSYVDHLFVGSFGFTTGFGEI